MAIQIGGMIILGTIHEEHLMGLIKGVVVDVLPTLVVVDVDDQIQHEQLPAMQLQTHLLTMIKSLN